MKHEAIVTPGVSVPRLQFLGRDFTASIVVFLVAMPLCMQSGSLASEVLIFGLAAMGCNLLLGYTGLLSFGQGIFFGLGSYTIALLLTRWTLPMPLALLAAVAMGAAGAAIVGWVAIRQRGTYFVMLTLAFAQMFYFLAYTATDLTGGDNGLLDIPRPSLAVAGQTLWPLDSPWQYYGFVAVLFLLILALILSMAQLMPCICPRLLLSMLRIKQLCNVMALLLIV